MPTRKRWRIGQRIEVAARVLAIGTILALAVLGPTTYVAVHQSSTAEFCKTCHIMDPYYESWERSTHAEVTCIVCHFEPGGMGTLKGKFEALTQLTKYVTRTAGTRPWAHVSDASCTQCHSIPDLIGPLDFNGIAFDHGPHLLQMRGKQLRCVTCHSQVVVEEHFAVQTSVCFSCHFMPGPDGLVPDRTGDCRLCHGPPEHELLVAGAPFAHDQWVAAGVDCRACHADAVSGSGTVHPQRCKSCHGQPELLAQIDAPDLLHRVHVTNHKVECLECHVEIAHGLSPRTSEPAHGAGDCGACHSAPHEVAHSMYAGTGALGVADQPSRMLETKVACEACHTGRLAGWSSSGARAHGKLALAGEVDCLHCHGTAFAGMLAQWQGAVGGGLDALSFLADDLRGHLAALSDGELPEAQQLLAQARANLEFVRADGSRGAHNVAYALEVLRSAAASLDEAWARVDPEREVTASAALPGRADAACAACHVAVALEDPLQVGSRPFHHERHLRVGLDCASCHLEAPLGRHGHGSPSFPRTECASCHHTESELVPDPTDCSTCHALQLSFLEGTVAGLEGIEAPMAEKGCENCHADPPDLMNPTPQLCVLCHEAGYDETYESWRSETARLVQQVEEALARAGADAPLDALEAARRALALVRADGSQGVHAFPLTEALLTRALEQLGAR